MWKDLSPLAASALRPRRITWPLCRRLSTMQRGHQITVKVTTKYPWGFCFTQCYQNELNSWAREVKKRLYWTETAAFPVKMSLPFLFLLSFIHFKYTSSRKVNRLWVSVLLYLFYARSEMWCFCLCFSLKTLADPLCLISCTLRVHRIRDIYRGVFRINLIWLSNEFETIRGGSH